MSSWLDLTEHKMLMQADFGGSGAPGTGPAAPEWTVEMARAMEAVLPKDVTSLIKSMIPMMASQAWVYMGKVMHPVQRTITKDLTQARLAVNVAGALLEQVDPLLSPDERQQMRQMVTELRLNLADASRT
jgi:Domain of unknown function (DUF1844)